MSHSKAVRKESVVTSTSSASTSVLPFARPQGQEAMSQTLVGNRLPPLNELGDRLRGALEAVIAESYFQQLLATGAVPDNPFDEIYISRIVPDPIALADLERISRYVNIADLSASIAFDDGWED